MGFNGLLPVMKFEEIQRDTFLILSNDASVYFVMDNLGHSFHTLWKRNCLYQIGCF